MRLAICDDHVVFAESLAHALAAKGTEIVAVTNRVDQLVEVLRRDRVDVCLLDVWFGGAPALDRLADVRAASVHTRILLLTALVDASLLAAGRAAGVDAIADKSQHVAQLIELLDRVCAGQPVPPPALPVGRPADGPARPARNDGQRLARFLTPRERQVLAALVRGDDTAALAASLGVSVATARGHVQNVLTKLGAHSRVQAATNAVRCGMVDPRTGAWIAPVDDRNAAPRAPRSRVRGSGDDGRDARTGP